MTLHDLHVRQLKQDPRRTCPRGGSFCIPAKFRSLVAFSTIFRPSGSVARCAYSSSGAAYIISCVDSDNAWAGLKLMSNAATDLHRACLNFKGWVVLGPVPAVGVILTMCTLGYFHPYGRGRNYGQARVNFTSTGEGKTFACFTYHHHRSLRVELGFGHTCPANELARPSFEGNQIAEISLS